jgi:large subunit ribosomal protein L4
MAKSTVAAKKTTAKPAKKTVRSKVTVKKPEAAKTKKAPKAKAAAAKKPVIAKPPVQEEKLPRTAAAKNETVSIGIVDAQGKAKGKMQLPAALFAARINQQTIAQAVRVYQANQRAGGAATKTRGEVAGSTRKIYRQKGTGRARHGGIRAPIFVGGGIVFGPRPKNFNLQMPKKMKKSALAGALTSQFNQGNVIVVDGLESLEPKTRIMVKSLAAVGGNQGPLLLITGKEADMVRRAARNIPIVDMLSPENLHVYAVMSHRKLVFTKGAVEALMKSFNQ